MGKPRLGEKHTCPNCEARFFDLGKSPAMCPKCGTVDVLPKPKPASRSSKAAVKPVEATQPEPVVKAVVADADEVDVDDIEAVIPDVDDDDDDDLDVALDDDDDDDDLIEDTSDIDDDDEGLSAVRGSVDGD